MLEISTILWDVGGVLLTNGWDHNERNALFSQFGIDRDAFEQRHPDANDAWEKGHLTVEQYLDHTLFYEPRNFTPGEFLEAMKAQSQVLDHTALPVLKQLAASEEWELGILNNEARELNDFRIEKFDLLDYFDVFLSSCYIGLRKPDTAMYKLALDVLQRDPDSVIFIDDRATNAEAAAALGIHAIHYQNPAQLEEALARLGITTEAY